MITTGHLCSGYDGIGRGLALVRPHETLWHAEIDPDMSSVLAKHEPDVPNVGDIKTAPWRLAPHADIVTSGDPCQSISVAGRREGRTDPRFLWPWVREVIRTVRPGAVFLENVANMVSHDHGRTLAERLGDLRAMGYAARWTVLGACAVGAPHHRHRWFLVAGYVGSRAPEAARIGAKAMCGAPRNSGRSLLFSPKSSDGRGHGLARVADGKDPWDDLPTQVAMLPTPNARDGDARGTPSREHAARRAADPSRSTNLEDAVALLPTPLARDADARGQGDAQYWGAREARRMPLGAAAALLPTPTATNRYGNQVNNRDELLLPGIALRPEQWGRFAEAVALWERITGVPAPEPTEPNTKGGRRMSPLLPEWMMGLPTGLLSGHLPRSAAIKGAGNGVVPLQAAAAWRLLTEQP